MQWYPSQRSPPWGVDVHSPLFLFLAHGDATASVEMCYITWFTSFLAPEPLSLTFTALGLFLPNEISKLESLPQALLFLRTWVKTVMLYSQFRTLDYHFKFSSLRPREGNEKNKITSNSEKHPTLKQWAGVSCEYGI